MTKLKKMDRADGKKYTKSLVFVLCVAILITLMPTVAQADGVAYIDSDITVNTTWSAGTYYICKTADNNEPKVAEGVTLTIESDSTVYFGNRVNEPVPSTDDKFPYSCLTVNGTLSANGVTFTTIPDTGEGTPWKDAGWQGIIVKSVDSTNAASASFTNCIFTNSKGEGTLRGVDSNVDVDGQTINITVKDCVFEDPIGVGSEFAAAISYNNGYHRAGEGTLNVSDTTITGYNRGIRVWSNQRDEIDISIDGCTFNNIAKEPVRLESGRSALTSK